MITGFNTDIEYDGVVYHVQTEDKGLDSPLILSLVYSGGAILASKRSRYEDLIASGFDEAVLSERLKRQHRLICAAINAGRIDELKRMGGKGGAEPEIELEVEEDQTEVVPQKTKGAHKKSKVAPEKTKVVAEKTEVAAGKAELVPENIIETSPEAGEAPAVPVRPEDTIEIVRTADEMYRDTAPLIMPDLGGSFSSATVEESAPAVVPEVSSGFGHIGQVELPNGVTLVLLDDEEFHAGREYTMHIMLEDKSALTPKPLGGIPVSVKILGTAFRPQLYSVNTTPNGVAIVSATMPNFISGRAAVLVRAIVGDDTIELRTPIHPTTV